MSHHNILQEQTAKKAAGYYAADLVQNGMIVGLGTGSTTTFFIEKLIERYQAGLKIYAVASSERSEIQAKKGGIPILDINTLTGIDLTVDGADEIDPKKQMIKGGGGALLREKLIASMSDEMIVIVDESKLVDQLGKFPLPLEIIPFAHQAVIYHIEALGFKGKLRMNEGEIYRTDNGNYIYDIQLQRLIDDPIKIDLQLRNIVGVLETGLFIHLAGRVVIGYGDGSVKIRS